MFNSHCFTCKKDFRVLKESNRCPDCGSKMKVLGVVTKIVTSNGKFGNHL